MARQDLVDYIKLQFKKGRNKEDVTSALVSAGWKPQDIEDAFSASMGINTLSYQYDTKANYTGNYSDNANSGALPGAGALLGEAWELYKPKIKTFAGIIILQLIAGIVLVVIMILAALIFGAGSSIFGASASNLIPPPEFIPPSPDVATVSSNIFSFFSGFVLIMMLFMVPLIIIQVWGQAAMIYVIKDSEENIGVMEAYRRSWRKIGSLFWTGLFSFIIIAGGLMLFAIPGIIFAIWFMFASYIVISEDISGMNALLKSREYIRGRGWEVFVLLLVMFLIWLGISVGAQFGFGIISIIFTAMGLGLIGAILSLFFGIVLAMMTPLMMTYSYLIYKHLKRLKGEFIFAPSSATKLKFIAVGILGIIVGLAIILVPMYLISVLTGSYNQPKRY